MFMLVRTVLIVQIAMLALLFRSVFVQFFLMKILLLFRFKQHISDGPNDGGKYLVLNFSYENFGNE